MNNSSNAIRGKARKRISKRQGIQPLRHRIETYQIPVCATARFRHDKQSLPPGPPLRRLLCRFPLVVLQQASQSFSTSHCSPMFPLTSGRERNKIRLSLPGWLRSPWQCSRYCCNARRNDDSLNRDQPRQTFFFDRLHPAFRVRVQIQASCWQLKRISS